MASPLRSDSAAQDAGARETTRLPSFEEFYRDQHPRLFVSLCLVTGSREEAEEIMQEAFLRLLARWDRMAAVTDHGGYLFQTAMNVFRNRYRRAKLAIRTTLAQPSADGMAAVESRDAVVRALGTLPRQQRHAVVLTWLLGYSSEEAGRMLGIRGSTVRVLTTRARAAMKERADDLR